VVDSIKTFSFEKGGNGMVPFWVGERWRPGDSTTWRGERKRAVHGGSTLIGGGAARGG
jgi:hypothetical protein